MNNNLPRVLVISSVDPFNGPGIVGLEHYSSLKKGGLEVDFMTKYPVKGHPEFISVFDNQPSYNKRPFIYRAVKRIFGKLSFNPLNHQRRGFFFFYAKEDNPPVPVERVVSKIKKQYDVVYIMFWQGLLSFATIDSIYDKLHCQIQFRCVDFSPMSGGCHFTGDCQRYKIGCGFCPGIGSHREEDFTRWNLKFRLRVYRKVKPIVYGNSHMLSYYRQSYLLKDYDRCEVVLPLVDNEKYMPLDPESSRKQYSIPSNKSFVILVATQFLDDERKGIKYLLEALNLFYDKLSTKERESVLLILVGHNVEAIKDSLRFDYSYLGYVKQDQLPGIYSMSNVYLSPSINDAGPSMVNQSISCGTPVVSFEMGTAIDVVRGQGTGYCARLKDSEDFANGIFYIFNLRSDDYFRMRERCREFAVTTTSEDSHFARFLDVYNKYI